MTLYGQPIPYDPASRRRIDDALTIMSYLKANPGDKTAEQIKKSCNFTENRFVAARHVLLAGKFIGSVQGDPIKYVLLRDW
jgi:hypothetical protein